MTESVSGRGGQAQEARCYNCGCSGHWAVACPEPTRETPAGLAAWRKSSSIGQGSARGRAHGSASKRSKGPIITKYTPPPSQPSFVTAVSSFAQHPYGPHHPPTSYPPSIRPFQYGAPPPLPVGYPQPTHSYHLPDPYGPPAPLGSHRYGFHGASGPSSAPSPPLMPFAPGGPSSHEYMIPPSYNNQFVPHSAPSHRPIPAKHSPSRAAHVRRPDPPSARAVATPSQPPIVRVSHPLPPKPPPSHDQVHPQRDHHQGKRKFERLHHQDRRHKAFRSTPPQTLTSPHPSPSANPRHKVYTSASPSDRPPPGASIAYAVPEQPRRSLYVPKETGPGSLPPKHETGPVAADGAFSEIRDKPDLDTTCTESAAKPIDAAAVEEKQPSSLFESELKQTDAAKEQFSLPPRLPMSHSALDSPETELEAKNSPPCSDEQEDGEISSDEAGPGATPNAGALPDGEWKSPASRSDFPCGRNREHTNESENDVSNAKRRKSIGAAAAKVGVCENLDVNGDLWDSLDIPRQADRKRKGSTASRGSRRSSVSSKSSDLNSLEAELLGRPKNQKQPEPDHSEHKKPPRPKRRQNNANSAYSRRW